MDPPVISWLMIIETERPIRPWSPGILLKVHAALLILISVKFRARSEWNKLMNLFPCLWIMGVSIRKWAFLGTRRTRLITRRGARCDIGPLYPG